MSPVGVCDTCVAVSGVVTSANGRVDSGASSRSGGTCATTCAGTRRKFAELRGGAVFVRCASGAFALSGSLNGFSLAVCLAVAGVGDTIAATDWLVNTCTCCGFAMAITIGCIAVTLDSFAEFASFAF